MFEQEVAPGEVVIEQVSSQGAEAVSIVVSIFVHRLVELTNTICFWNTSLIGEVARRWAFYLAGRGRRLLLRCRRRRLSRSHQDQWEWATVEGIILIKNLHLVVLKVFEYNGEGNFGELALLYNQPRAATVQVEDEHWTAIINSAMVCVAFAHGNNLQAISEGKLWKMDRQTFRKIVLKSAFQVRKKSFHMWNHLYTYLFFRSGRCTNHFCLVFRFLNTWMWVRVHSYSRGTSHEWKVFEVHWYSFQW